MINRQIRLKKGFPAGVVFLEEKLRPLVEKIYLLGDRDIRELDAFMDYLINGSVDLYKSGDLESSKVFEFMQGGLVNTGAGIDSSTSYEDY